MGLASAAPDDGDGRSPGNHSLCDDHQAATKAFWDNVWLASEQRIFTNKAKFRRLVTGQKSSRIAVLQGVLPSLQLLDQAFTRTVTVIVCVVEALSYATLTRRFEAKLR